MCKFPILIGNRTFLTPEEVISEVREKMGEEIGALVHDWYIENEILKGEIKHGKH